MKRTLLLCLLLAGCAHKKPEVQFVEVPVISPVRCINPADLPPEPPRVRERFNGDAKHDLEILAENAQELREWGEKMRALLEPCVGRAPPT